MKPFIKLAALSYLFCIINCANLFAQQSNINTIHLVIAADDTSGFYYFKTPIDENYSPDIEVENIQSVLLKDTVNITSGEVSHYLSADFVIAKERKQSYIVGQMPTLIRTVNGIEKVIACDLVIKLQKNNVAKAKKHFAANSVLATGQWYKMGVTQKGVYKIDYNGLSALGINPGTIDARNIRIYGNGGHAIAESVDTNFIDDLAENAIFVSATGSTFGANDYILFYNNGLLKTTFFDANEASHINNPYESQAYYFITVDKGLGKRIPTENNVATPATVVYNTYHEYKLMDLDSASISNIGKVWWGSRMNALNPATLNPTFNFNLGNPVSNLRIKAVVGNLASNSATLTLSSGNTTIKSEVLDGVTNLDNFYTYKIIDATFPAPSGNISLKLNYSLNGGNAGSGYVDYISIYYENSLQPYESQLVFRNANALNYNSNDIIQYDLLNAGSHQVWNVTDPTQPIKMNGSLNGSTLSIRQDNAQLNEYIAFNNTFYTPAPLGIVANQNLHALSIPDLLIITDPSLRSAAEALADYRNTKNGYVVHVVDKQLIYNEFGSGKQDIGAIRNFIKMFYDRASGPDDLPKGILFFGAASFDFKDRVANNTNFIPTYQSDYSHVKFAAFSSDDYYALLDDGEDFTNNNAINSNLYDIAIGRIPAMHVEEGLNAVNKIKHYESPDGFGSWKSNLTYVADDIDENGSMNHMKDCEVVNDIFLNSIKDFNLYKIYADAYKKVSTSSGLRYPSVNKAINDQIYNGTLFINYFGHGSPERWADEAILTNDDIKSWNNNAKLPLFFTGTCDFGRYDNPAEISAGVNIFNKKNSGAIGLITTTQVVFAFSNLNFSNRYLHYQFNKDANHAYRTVAEALRLAKNDNSASGNNFDNNKMYVFLGDPTMYLAIPNNVVKTAKISLIQLDSQRVETDTMKALGKYELEGTVADKDDNILQNFNGKVEVAIYDKVKTIETINTHPQASKSYQQQTNSIAKVVVDVVDGKFKAAFVVPKDIMLDIGKSKIIYYAWSAEQDALGLDTNIYLGDMADEYEDDNHGPVVKVFIDDNKFRNGGVTGPNPLLYSELYDDNGINVSGSSVGHDLVAILDENLQSPYIMNGFYQTYPNQYQKGFVYFPLSNLADGQHTIRVKAWDTYNNSGEGSVSFQVKSIEDGVINTLYTYPNPFSNGTTIVFQHNQKGKEMNVDIAIFSVTGAIVQRISKTIVPQENRTEIYWDGKNMHNAPIHPGVYVYKLSIVTEDGIKANATEKLVKTLD